MQVHRSLLFTVSFLFASGLTLVFFLFARSFFDFEPMATGIVEFIRSLYHIASQHCPVCSGNAPESEALGYYGSFGSFVVDAFKATGNVLQKNFTTTPLDNVQLQIACTSLTRSIEVLRFTDLTVPGLDTVSGRTCQSCGESANVHSLIDVLICISPSTFGRFKV